MRIIPFVIFCVSVAFVSNAQDVTADTPAEEILSGSGSVMLNNDTELMGTILYNELTEEVSFDAQNKARIFTSLNIIGFEYFDASQSKQRIFFSLPYEDPRTKEESEHFYEVLRQYKNFALVSRIESPEFNLRRRQRLGKSKPMPQKQLANVPIVEKLFFLNHDDKIMPYLDLVASGGKEEQTRINVIDNHIVATMLGDKFSEASVYAADKSLSFQKKHELLQILDYYDSLLVSK